MNIQFKDITPENWRIINGLKVKEEQQEYVALNVAIVARAYAYRMDNSKAIAIYNGDIPIGLIMQRDYTNDNKLICILDQFMIDKKWQGKGYGKQAMIKWISEIEKTSIYHSIELCFIDGDVVAEKLYKSLGFVRTPEYDDQDELVMCKIL